MPIVQTYQPNQARTEVAGRTQASAMPTGLDSLARGVGSLANTAQGFAEQQAAEKLRLQKEAQVNRLKASQEAARQSVVEFERGKNELFFNRDNGYFNTQGRNAFEGADGATKKLEEMKKKYAESLDPVARQEFDRVADIHLTRAFSDIQRHSSTNLKAWKQANIEAQVENALENSALYWNDDQRLKTQQALGGASVLDAADLQGLSPEATEEKLQNFESAFAVNVVQAAANKSASDGEAMLKKHGKNIEGPDRVKLENAIAKQREAEEVKQRSRETVLRATNLVADYGERTDARAAMLEDINKIEDPELRKSVMSEATYQLNLKQQADAEQRGKIFEEAEFQLYNGASMESFKAARPNDWAKLSPKQQVALTSATSVKTDYVQFADLSLMSKEDLAKINPSDYFNVLAAPERKQLIAMVENARRMDKPDENQVGRSRATQTSSTVEQLFGKKSNWSNDKKEQVNVFYGVIDSEVRMREKQKGAALTSKEYTEVLYQFTRDYVTKGFIFDSTDNLSDIPANDLKSISEYLNKNNIPATVDNIFKAYQQAQK
jgi:hypothetical protein